MTTPNRLVPRFLDKTNCPRGFGTTGPFYNPHTVPFLNFAWLSRGIPLLRTHGTGLLRPFTPSDSIKRILPGYRPPVGQRRQQYPQLAPGPVPELSLLGRLPRCQNYVKPHGDPPRPVPQVFRQNEFPQILTPRARYPQDSYTIPTRSCPWPLTSSPVAYRYLGHPAQVSCAHLPPPWGSIKRIFPWYRPPWGKWGNNPHNSH